MALAAQQFVVEPIRATRTFEAAIEHLAEAIERARLRPGDRLPSESELALALGISKPTLRQALRVLEAAGVLAVRRGKGGGIVLLSDVVHAPAVAGAVALEEGAVAETLRARRVLERAVAIEAAERATPDDLDELERTIDLLERSLGDRPAVMRADAAFHRALARACHNSAIQSAVRGLARAIAPIRDAYSGGVATDRRTLDVHRRQLAAMRRRDLRALEQALDEHFSMLEEAVAAAIRRTPGQAS
ncbi:MAG TPA: FCD domain-containing protein [Gaiella sp.]|jgi:GntR family transcriptional repressor for pyruvate dehydrogenase complex